MRAVRFFIIGYGIAAGLGMFAGAKSGILVGLLLAWFGGGAITLLIAWAWFRGHQDANREAGKNTGAVQTSAHRPAVPGEKDVVEVWRAPADHAAH